MYWGMDCTAAPSVPLCIALEFELQIRNVKWGVGLGVGGFGTEAL